MSESDDMLARIQRRKAELGAFLMEALEDDEIAPEEVAEAEADLAELKAREADFRARLERTQRFQELQQQLDDIQLLNEYSLLRRTLKIARDVFATTPPESEMYQVMKAIVAENEQEEALETLDDPEVWPPSLLEKIAAWETRDRTGEAKALEQAMEELRKVEHLLS